MLKIIASLVRQRKTRMEKDRERERERLAPLVELAPSLHLRTKRKEFLIRSKTPSEALSPCSCHCPFWPLPVATNCKGKQKL